MEEKKKFEKPEMQVVQLQHEGMLCGSCDPHGCLDGTICDTDCGSCYSEESPSAYHGFTFVRIKIVIKLYEFDDVRS